MSGNAKHQAAVATTAEKVAGLRIDIHRQLGVIRVTSAQLEDLVSTRQSVGLGFMTEDARTARDKQTLADRAAARGQVGRVELTGLVWMNTTTVLGTGQVAAPVTMTAVSASVEILFALQHHVRRLARPAAIAAAATIPGGHGRPPIGLTTDADIDGLTDQLDDLVDAYVNRQGLEGLLRDLDRLEETALEVIEGPARTSHPDVCPWCGRPTLVIHHREKGRDSQYIRCEGQHACECSYEWCDCHRNPVRNRHEWINSGRAAHTWNELHNLQTKRKELILMETQALDALERIRQLHTASTVGADGREHPVTVLIFEDDLEDFDVVHDCSEYCFADRGQHEVLACNECGDTEQTSITGHGLWPCPTIRAIDPPDDSRVAGDDTTEERAL